VITLGSNLDTSVVAKRAALVVEDDAAIRAALLQLLDDSGFEVSAASNGWAGLNLLRGGLRPDVILLDLVMPIMNGWDFRRGQLLDPNLRAIPVILITAAESPREKLQSDLGDVELIRKPPRADEILAAISRATAGSI